MYKFRTFRCDYDDQHDREFMKDFVKGHISQSSDSKSLCKPITKQITRLGQILRKASLDEIPQLINVWRGEMSIIGPRPNVPWEVEAYEDWHRERLDALPGITGLAQVRGRSSISFDSIVHYDIEYIKKQSLKLDFKILWWTVSWVVSGKGAG
jgi:lipopolysaccharide/colanic/teichoic acid biosynthesis glycosyltransferase